MTTTTKKTIEARRTLETPEGYRILSAAAAARYYPREEVEPGAFYYEPVDYQGDRLYSEPHGSLLEARAAAHDDRARVEDEEPPIR